MKKAKIANRREDQGKERRNEITTALRHLILEHGYAEITLTDLARASGMSVSHLLYYFPSKEAVLEAICTDLFRNILSEVTALGNQPPEERIHVIVDNLFLQNLVPREELAIVLELLSIALHRPAIRKFLVGYKRAMTDYLVDLFEEVPRQPGLSASDAAEIAAALWQGLLTNWHFDSNLDTGRVRRVFRRSLLALANIPNTYSHAYPPLEVQEPAPRAHSGTPRRAGHSKAAESP